MKVLGVGLGATDLLKKNNKSRVPNFKAKVDFVNKNTLNESLKLFDLGTKRSLTDVLFATEEHFKKMGSDYLNIQMGIRDFLSAVPNGTSSLVVWASFKPFKEAKNYLLDKYGFALSESKQKAVESEKPSLVKALEFGEYIYGVDLIKSSGDDLKIYADESYSDVIDYIKRKYPLESGEGAIFKRLVDKNTGFRKIIKDFWGV